MFARPLADLAGYLDGTEASGAIRCRRHLHSPLPPHWRPGNLLVLDDGARQFGAAAQFRSCGKSGRTVRSIEPVYTPNSIAYGILTGGAPIPIDISASGTIIGLAARARRWPDDQADDEWLCGLRPIARKSSFHQGAFPARRGRGEVGAAPLTVSGRRERVTPAR